MTRERAEGLGERLWGLQELGSHCGHRWGRFSAAGRRSPAALVPHPGTGCSEGTVPQEGDNAPGSAPPRPAHSAGPAGAAGAVGILGPKQSPPSRAPSGLQDHPSHSRRTRATRRGTCRAKCSSLASTPSSRDVLRINPTLELRVGTIRLLQTLEFMGKSQNSFFKYHGKAHAGREPPPSAPRRLVSKQRSARAAGERRALRAPDAMAAAPAPPTLSKPRAEGSGSEVTHRGGLYAVPGFSPFFS